MSYFVIILYFVFLALISVLSYRTGFSNVFSTAKQIPWYLAGFSIFIINPDTINILSKMGIVAEKGYSGMWIFYTAVLGAGFMPIIFAPLWSRLRFMTDNQFILFRFSGRPARILHLFRAVYVGYLVVALFIAQVFIALSKLIIIFFEVSYSQSFLIVALLVVLIIMKNSLRLKVRTDFFNGIVYILAFALGGFFVVQHFGGFTEMYSRLNNVYPDYVRLFPDSVGASSFETWPTVLVYFFIQWWSINVLDGGAPEAQRFMNIHDPFGAFKAAFLPLVLFSLVFLFHSFVIDAGILLRNEQAGLIPVINGAADLEAGFIELYLRAMPEVLTGLVFIAFLVGFISFLESFINWGAGFITVDVFRTYIFTNRSDTFYNYLSYAVMLLIALTGILIAWHNTHLLGLQKFIFAMGAGVGPVFILRWFWWRINAWSQFTAMLASLVFAVGWDTLYEHSTYFTNLIDAGVLELSMSHYTLKLCCLTVMVTLAWLLVTFLTPSEKKDVIEKFRQTVHQDGRPWGMKRRRQRILLLCIYPIISILPFLMIWQFKFGTLIIAAFMLLGWFALLYFTVKQMARLER